MILQARALLFDMDGTLVDSTVCVERTWERWGRRHGIALGDILAVSHGRRTADTIRDVAPRALASARLRFAGLPEPRVLVGAEDVRAGKPDPEGYLKAAALLSALPAACVVLEDTPAGILAARAAGMRVLAVGTTFPPADLLGAAWVPHFADVTFAAGV